MEKIYILLSALAVTLLSATVAASVLIPNNANAVENSKAPEKSPVISITEPGVWKLQSNGLERMDIIHYAKDFPKQNPAKPTGPACYKLMGVKWNALPVSYVINPSNPQGLDAGFVTSTISTSAETWDASTRAELFNNIYTTDYAARYGVQNYRNEMSFGNYSQAGVIAITSIWRNKATKAIVEFDIMFDTDFVWGDATVNPAVMDLQNIATHELGHGIGLSDIYQSACSSVTMYGYSTEGDVDGRTLEQPDIMGLQAMYGP